MKSAALLALLLPFHPQKVVADVKPVEVRVEITNSEITRYARYHVVAQRDYEVAIHVARSNGEGLLALDFQFDPAALSFDGNTAWTGKASSYSITGRIRASEAGVYKCRVTARDTESMFEVVYFFEIVAVSSLPDLHDLRAIAPAFGSGLSAVPGGEASKTLDHLRLATSGRIQGVVVGSQYSNNRRYPLRGVQVELWGFYGTYTDKLLRGPIYTVEATSAGNCGLNEDTNYVEGTNWYHADNAGYFDFGQVDSNEAPIFYVKIKFRFADGGNGTSSSGSERLVVKDKSGNVIEAKDVVLPLPQTGGYYIMVVKDPDPDDSSTYTLAPQASHILYDVSRTYGYFRDCVNFKPSPATATIDLETRDPDKTKPVTYGLDMFFYKWQGTDYFGYERTDSLVHEYAHVIHTSMRGGSLPARANGDTNHGNCQNSNSTDALMEGWARFVPLRIFNTSVIHWDASQTRDLAPDSTNSACENDEYTFGSSLWDLYTQGNADPNLSFKQIAASFDKHDPTLVRGFYDGFVNDYPVLCQLAYDTFENHKVTYPNLCGGATPASPMPANGTSGVTAGSALSWAPVSGANSYDVYFGESNPPPFVSQTSSTTFTPPSFLAGKTYYWRIVSSGSLGSVSSPVWSFATAAAAVGLKFVPLTPCRIADTRNPSGPFGGPPIAGNTSRSLAIPSSACNVPTTAQAYSLNVTVVPQGPLSYLTIWPTGQTQPLVSTLNSGDGRAKANAAIVPAGTNGAVSVFVTNPADVILDINGYFVAASSAPANALQFYPLPPCRISDTRNANGSLGGPSVAGGTTRTIPVATTCSVPAGAQAYSLNFTSVPSGPLAYISTWPAGQAQPLVSTLNAPTGAVTANAAIVPAGANGAINVYASNSSDLVIDVNGYFAAPGGSGLSFYPVAPCRISDSRNTGGTFGGPAIGAGQTRSWPIAASACGLPAGAKAFALNATVVPASPLAYLTLWPAGGVRPLVSTLNSGDGTIVANAAIVPASADGSVSAFATSVTDLILDVSGYFAP